MEEIKGYKKSTAKPWKRYKVYRIDYYGHPHFVSETVAKSEKQAVNNVRWKFGKKYESNWDFEASEAE